jgi:hypothetical protein
MRKVALAIAIAAVVGGCQQGANSVGSNDAAVGAQDAPPEMIAVQAPLQAVSSVAANPDRGQLFTYSNADAVRVGASTRREIKLSEAHALQATVDGTMTIQAPDGSPVQLKFARRVEHKDGNWSFVGAPEGAKPGEQAVITFGEKAVFGLIPNKNGEPLEITTIGGRTYAIETDGSKLKHNDASLANDTIAAVMAGDTPIASSQASTSDRLSLAAASGAKLKASGLVASKAVTASNTVDLLLGYTVTFAARYGGTSQAVTRLTAMVDIANSALEASVVDAQFRLVGTQQVDFSETTTNRTTLFQLTGMNCTAGTQTGLPDGGVNCTPAARPAALEVLATRREELGADIVGLVRTFQSPEQGSCGLGWLSGAGQTAIDANDAPFGFVVVSDTEGNTFPDDGSSCRSDNLAHELGHVLGLAHDRAAAATNNGDTVLDADEFGRYPYAFGYWTGGSGAGQFHDTMGIRRANVTSRIVYSSPTVQCGTVPCGVANEADAARALRQTIAMVAAFRDVRVALPGSRTNDFSGDGRSDILWRNTSTGANQVWLAANSATQQAINTVNAVWRIAGTGDFNGDGRGDILWRNSSTGAGTIYLSGSSATQQAVATVSNLQWQAAGVGDFNGDGRSDILWRNSGTGANTIWLSANNATQLPVATVNNFSWKIVGVGDFDGNGIGDILWRNSSTGANLIWRSGNVATQQPISPVGNQQWSVVGVEDFDGDGVSDILWRNTTSGANTIWRGGNNSTQQAVATVGNQAWRVVRTGDYDGDGVGDILWRNSTTGQNLLWRSANVGQQTVLTTVAGTAWQIQG